MTSKADQSDTFDDEAPEKAIDPHALAETTRAAAERLREIAAEARELFDVVGKGYTYSKGILPIPKRYEWREKAGLPLLGDNDDQRMAARWTAGRAEIESKMGVAPMMFSPRSLLSAYGAWQKRKGKRISPAKREWTETLAELPELYDLKEVEQSHAALFGKVMAETTKATSKVNKGTPDWRLELAVLKGAYHQVLRRAAVEHNMGQSEGNTIDLTKLESEHDF
ncbi:hypothetical protein LJR130_004534 [Variovorax sp. LjRoot130]|uniref:hypothetical protein n=1 Tax=Variovorax sp. LjRoot130 TaxID=3342261 RepID=UPI003ECF13D4